MNRKIELFSEGNNGTEICSGDACLTQNLRVNGALLSEVSCRFMVAYDPPKDSTAMYGLYFSFSKC